MRLMAGYQIRCFGGGFVAKFNCAVLLFVVYVNRLERLVLIAVNAYVFFMTDLPFDVGVSVDMLSKLSFIFILCELNMLMILMTILCISESKF